MDPMLVLSSPDSVQFRVVYDVRHSFPDTAFAAFVPLIVVVIGFVVYRQRNVVARFGGSSLHVSLFALAAMLIGGAGALFLLVGTILPDIGLRIALADGHYQVHEGLVSDFVPGDGHRPERWILRTPDSSFSYSYSPPILKPGYNKIAPEGGYISNGLHVRLWDVGGDIARLEVAP
jgi:hypothetical protein